MFQLQTDVRQCPGRTWCRRIPSCSPTTCPAPKACPEVGAFFYSYKGYYKYTPIGMHAQLKERRMGGRSTLFFSNLQDRTIGKWAENRQKIGGIRKHVIGKTAEWACTMEDGVPGLSFSAQISLIWADNSAQNRRSVLPGRGVYTIHYIHI